MQLNKRQLATVLAALRYWQREGIMSCGHEHDIASDGDTLTPLTAVEIDALCEELNFPHSTSVKIQVPPALWVSVLDALDERIECANYLAPEKYDDDEHEQNSLTSAADAIRILAEARSLTTTPACPPATADENSSMNCGTAWYRNHYKCPCGNEWQDEWECMCNDRCASCGKEIEPHHSDELPKIKTA